MNSMGSYEGMPTRSVCQLEFRCPMSLPRALKESSGCISMTTTFAPSSAARRAVAVPAWPAPHTTMSASTVSAMSLSGMSGSSPSQPAPSTSPMVLPALPVGAAPPWLPQRPRQSPCRLRTKWHPKLRLAGCIPASMPAPAAPGRQRARALQEAAAAELDAARASWRTPPFGLSVKRGSFLSTSSPFLSCLGMPRLGRRRGGRTDRRLLAAEAAGCAPWPGGAAMWNVPTMGPA